jgi:hypothetical protein
LGIIGIQSPGSMSGMVSVATWFSVDAVGIERIFTSATVEA